MNDKELESAVRRGSLKAKLDYEVLRTAGMIVAFFVGILLVKCAA